MTNEEGIRTAIHWRSATTGESAKSLKRPGLQRTLAMLERREAEALPGQCATGARTYKTGRHVGGTHGRKGT